MSRRGNIERQAAQAAEAASEAGRVLQAQRETLKDYAPAEPKAEQASLELTPKNEPKPDSDEQPQQRKPKERQEKPETDEKKPETLLRNEPRRRALEEIERRDLKDKGIVDEPVVDATVTEKAPKTEPVAEATQPVATVAAETPPVDAVPAAPTTVRVKVDGQEFDVSQAEVEDAGGVKAYQIIRAQENRLKKVNETVAQTRQIQAEIARWVQSQQPQTPALSDDQFIASKVDTIRFGTPEESAAALREVMQRGNPRVDPAQITQQAVSQMMKLQAVDNFKKEFQDVVGNPILLRAAAALENERQRQLGPETDWNQFFRSIGNEVRSAIPRQHQPAISAAVSAVAPTADNTSPASDKEARKASIVNLPTAAARAALPTEDKPESREEILNQMRKARHLPTG